MPHTAPLGALGNDVVSLQVADAVTGLLDDLAELLDADHRPEPLAAGDSGMTAINAEHH
ncbi:hypothetical protein AB0I91_07735 [Actinosynnema sp. NPDC049800]